jgi:glycosyltransferase domain-containing protein
MLNNLTLCIPTINRTKYLSRALEYYNFVNLDCKIIIGDSSDDEHKKQNKELIKKYNNLNIEYIFCDKKRFNNDSHVLKYLGNFVKTKYVTFAGDDDFIVPSGVEKCINFLDENNDFAAAHGIRLNFIENNGKIVHIETDEGYEWIKEDAWERWFSYMRRGIATVSFIHRTENWKKQYQLVGKMNTRYLGTELIICSTAAIQGKIKKIYDLSLIFQKETPERLFSFRKYTLWDLINSSDWYKSSEIFIEEVDKQLKEQGFNKGEEIKKEFWYHCLNVLINQFNNLGKQIVLPTTPLDLGLKEDDQFYPIAQLINEGKIDV